MIQVFDKSMTNKYYFTDEIKKALGHPSVLHHAAINLSNFPQEMTLNSNPKLPVPALGHADKPLTFYSPNLEIFVTPTDSFKMKFRDVFIDTKLNHHSGKESQRWLESRDMNYWPQQLNFAVWCATTGCGISSKLLFEDEKFSHIPKTDGELKLPKQVRSLQYGFTCISQSEESYTRWVVYRILYIVLPGDDAFDQKNNLYDIPSYKRLCNEFGISPSTDFRFNHGMNHGLGNVYIYFSHKGLLRLKRIILELSDEGGKTSDGNLIQYITSESSENQYEHFVLSVSYGLTKDGQARINQSIEAFVYCILGAQVNVRSSILGNSGSAQEVRRELLTLMEDAVKQPDISKSVQRFQLAVQEAKVKLDLAISSGTWLMPSKMVISTESTVGYNNKLKGATADMKLGVNSDVNADGTVDVGIRHNLGVSKVKLPHAVHMLQKADDNINIESVDDKTTPNTVKRTQTQHELNLILVMLAATDKAWF